MTRWLVPAFVLFAALAPLAQAQTPGIAALAGRWSVTTGPHPGSGCVIQGEATATRSGAALNIDLRVVQTCAGGVAYTAQEACVGRIESGMMQVRCTLVSAVEGYVADQFALRIASANEMSGRLNDGDQWDVPCTWRRPRGALVS